MHTVSRSDIVDPSATIRRDSPMFPELKMSEASPALRLLLVSTKRLVKGKVEKIELPVLVPNFDAEEDRNYPAWHPEFRKSV